MNPLILMELAKRWEADAKEPEVRDISAESSIRNAVEKGQRQAKRECADALKMLIQLLGDKSK